MSRPEDYYRLLVENYPDGIVFLYEGRDPPRYAFVSGSGLESIGLTKAELEGNPVAAGRPSEVRDQVRSQYRRALDGEEVSFETEVEGRYFHIELFPATDDGEVVYGMGIAQDVTEQKTYEQKLERQNRRLEQLTDALTHDLRNPLEVIGGRLELLRQETDSEHVDAIDTAQDRMVSLIDELLTLDHTKDPESMASVSLATLATDAWNNVVTDGASLDVVDDRRLTADATELRRLLENLYRNAVEHGSTSPDSQARTDAVEHGGEGVTVTVGALDDGFYVADDGPGIPESDRERVFERGYTTDDGGTGIGLFVVETVAETHGWTVEVTDSDAGGTRFEFTGAEE